MASYLNIQNKNLLIIDDNQTNILLMQAILEDAKYLNIYTASSAIEGYDVLENESIDLILMDISMPEIDGLEATQAIKANSKLSHIPIIIVTAVSDDETLKTSFEVGAVDFIRKPVNRVELISRLTNILEHQEKDLLIMQHSRFDAMEEIIGMLAHQWRQPLGIISAIVGSIQTQRALSLLKEDDLDTSLEKINIQTSELSNMITSFREFFKSDTPACLNSPNKAIQEAQRLMHEPLKLLEIEMRLELGNIQEETYIQNLLVQILTRIITNSKEAFEINDIDNKYIIIRSFIQNGKNHIVIEDNAGGINKDILNQIFEPYFTTKMEKNGKGLGLFISKNILIQQFNGKIFANSKNGKSEFLLIF